MASNGSDAGGVRPLIAISAYWRAASFGPWRDMPAALVPQGYVVGVQEAGGIAVLVPPDEAVAADASPVLDRVDGLVLVGGDDIDPAQYGAESHPLTDPPNVRRDASELGLLRGAIDRGMPVLGVCRGVQLLNVVYGGDLVQHLDDDYELAPHRPELGTFGRHPVAVDGGQLRDLVGRSRRRRPLAPPPGPRPPRRGADRHGPCRGRHRRGARGSGLAVLRRRPLAPRRGSDRRGRAAVPRARGSRPHVRARPRLTRGGHVAATAVEGLVVGGERTAAAEGRSFEVLNPATAAPLASVAEAGVEDVDRAVAAAARAYETWGALTPVKRGRVLHRFASLAEGAALRRRRSG